MAGMTEYSTSDSGEDQGSLAPPLPENLAALVGALQGPAGMGRNHDKYLAYPDREEAGGAASA
jgi:hypothetical protein